MIVHGKHRSKRLAERHRRELERENPGARVTIKRRDNADGEKSARGRFFTFEIEGGEIEVDTLEEFWEQYDEADEFEPEEFGSSADYTGEE